MRAAAGPHLEHDKQENGGDGGDHQQLVVVDIGDDLRLLREQGVERGAACGGEGIQDVRDGRIVEAAVHRRHVSRDIGVVDLGKIGQKRVDDRNADARTDVSRQVVEAGAVGEALGGQRGQGDDAQRHEQESKPEALDNADDNDRRGGDVGRPAGRLPERLSAQHEADRQEHACAETPHETTDDDHRDHRPKAAWTHDEPGGDDGIIHHLLQIGRLQRQRSVVGQPDDEDEQRSGDEIAVAEKGGFEKRVFRSEGVDEEDIERRGADDRRDDDLAGAEPDPMGRWIATGAPAE